MAKDPSRTEAATPKQISKAREKGNVPKSQEVTKTVVIIAGLVGIGFWARYIAREMAALFRHFLSQSAIFEVNDANMGQLGLWLALELAKMLLPIMLFIALAAFIILRVQVGKLWTTKVFEFKLEKFNPINGLKRMFFSLQTFVRLGKSLLQALCIGFAPWMVLKKEIPNVVTLYHADAMGMAVYLLSVGSRMVVYALVPMVVIAAIDWWYTRWDYAENLKMTKDEVKDERKQQEGDPLVKSQIRQKMMKMSARRMMADVPKADVVITNPTHISVALRYDPLEAPAPVILAMGADIVAMKIRDIAREHHIPIRENKALARALYNQADVGETIPADLFQAVAIVLAQIWKTRPPKRNISR
jgi:flagellar biosynthetic protein FlhB